MLKSFNFHPGSHTGQGCIVMDAMKRMATHPVLQNLPFILETPNDDAGYKEEIAIVNSWM